MALAAAIPLRAQSSTPLDLVSALDRARRWSASVRGARAAIEAARARERQSVAWSNPAVSWGREGTSRNGQANAQQIVQVELPLDVTGARQARLRIAAIRRQAEERRLEGLLASVDHETSDALLSAVAADVQVNAWANTRATFERAVQIVGQRLAAGDVSGLAARRLRLEAARMAGGAATSASAARAARVHLATLLGLDPRAGDTLTLPVSLSGVLKQVTRASSVLDGPLDSVVALAGRQRVEVQLALLDVELSLAERALIERERRPLPVVSAGAKVEKVADATAGSLAGFRGLVAGVTIPLPLLDRRGAAVDATAADALRMRAATEEWRRRIGAEVREAAASLEAARQHEAILAPHVGEEGVAALRAVDTAFAEGEASLLEWLDAVRAWHEATTAWNTLQADAARARLRLVRAAGIELLPSTSSNR